MAENAAPEGTTAPENSGTTPPPENNTAPAEPTAPPENSAAPQNGTELTDAQKAELGWRADLPDELRNDNSLAKFTSVEALAKSYKNAEKMIGADKIAIPQEGDENGWETVYNRLGRPEKPEGYGFAPPEKVPDGMQYDADLDKRIAAICHKRGLNKSQATGFREDLIEIVKEGAVQNIEADKVAAAELEKQTTAAEQELRADWGDAYDQRGKMAVKASEMMFSDATYAFLEQAGATNNPAFIKDLYNIGVKVQGEKELLGAVATEQSPADLEGTIAEFTEKNKAALIDGSHPNHVWAVKERDKLFRKRYK